MPACPDPGITELAQAGSRNPAAQLLCHGLHPVADTEDRHAQLENHIRRTPTVTAGYRFRPAGQYDGFGVETPDRRLVQVEGIDLVVDACLADAPGYQLGVLRTEVEDQDFVTVDIRHVSGKG